MIDKQRVIAKALGSGFNIFRAWEAAQAFVQLLDDEAAVHQISA
ncbi:MAG: hypothetical protein PF501_14485 [Salinisphaera sp.]|nr:hypothetical protein [Salinisphaera sp.]